jgi:hypothetical protein
MIHDPSIISTYSSRCWHFISYIISIVSPLLQYYHLPSEFHSSFDRRTLKRDPKNRQEWALLALNRLLGSVVTPGAAPSSRENSHVARITSSRAGALAIAIREYAAWYQLSYSSKPMTIIWCREHVCFH